MRKKRVPCTNVRVSKAVLVLAAAEADARDETIGAVLYRAAEAYFGKEKVEDTLRKIRASSYEAVKKEVASETEAEDTLFR